MTTRKFLRFLMYTLVVLCALGCVRVVEIGHPERIPVLVFYTCVWLCVGLGIHIVLDKWSKALDRTQRVRRVSVAAQTKVAHPLAVSMDATDEWLYSCTMFRSVEDHCCVGINPATGLPMMDAFMDVGGNSYGAGWRD